MSDPRSPKSKSTSPNENPENVNKKDSYYIVEGYRMTDKQYKQFFAAQELTTENPQQYFDILKIRFGDIRLNDAGSRANFQGKWYRILRRTHKPKASELFLIGYSRLADEDKEYLYINRTRPQQHSYSPRYGRSRSPDSTSPDSRANIA